MSRRETFWNLLFSLAIAVLMLAILLIRQITPPIWVLVSYPAVGAALAYVVNRTSPNRRQMLRLENAAISAAVTAVAALSVNAALNAVVFDNIAKKYGGLAHVADMVSFVFLVSGSALMWWGLERRISKMRGEEIGLEQENPENAALAEARRPRDAHG